jgi:PAS domain S-box-containing protein
MLIKKPLRKPISVRIFSVIVLIIVLQSVALLWVSSSQLRIDLLLKVEEDAQTTMISLQEILQFLAASNEHEQIQKTVTSLGAGLDVEEALLLDNNNNVIASTHVDAIGSNINVLLKAETIRRIKQQAASLKRSLKNVIWKSEDGQSLYAMSPVVLGRLSEDSLRSDKIGVMFIHYDLGWIENKIQEMLGLFLLPVVLMLTVAGLGLMFYFNASISRRIQVVNSAASRFSEADYDVRIKIDGNDEITDLGHAFNVMAQDVQEHHEELLDRERNLAITLSSIGDAVITTDTKGYVTRMNLVAEKLTGWSLEDALGQLIEAVFPIIDTVTQEQVENPIKQVMDVGEITYRTDHITLIAKDGTEYQIADSAAPIRDGDGDIQGMILIFSDVTEEYKLREAAAKSTRNLQAIMDNSPAVIYAKDPEGRYIFVNRRWEKLFDTKNRGVIGKTDYEIFPRELADEFAKNNSAVLAAGHALDRCFYMNCVGQ